jgi:hypothetical protein
MKKKVVSVILAMTMVASMAMGCGSSSDTACKAWGYQGIFRVVFQNLCRAL